jgi:hypothetical protein
MSGGDESGNAPALTGAFNFRDLGGLPTVGGRRTRPGLLFRSDTLQALTEADVAHLVRSLGVMLVMDLRDADEAVEQGRGLLGRSPLCYVNLPLDAAPTRDAAPPGDAGATLDFYLRHLESGSSVLPLALQILAVSLARVPGTRLWLAGDARRDDPRSHRRGAQTRALDFQAPS